MKKRKETLINPPDPPPENSVPADESSWRFLQNLSTSRGIFRLCAILLPFIALANFPNYLVLNNDQDLWFHLAYGREYVQNFTWSIDHSQFSWTPARSEWMYGTWLGSSLLYLIHEAVGVHGLFAASYLILGASAGAVLWLVRVSGVGAGIGLLAAFLAAAQIMSNYLKPETFSILLTTLTAVACLRFRMAPGPWIIAVLPILFLFWINIHGLWFFGVAFIGLFLLLTLFEHLFLPRQKVDPKALLMFATGAGLAGLALAANPDGVFYPAGVALSVIFPDDAEMLKQITAYASLWGYLLRFGNFSWMICGWINIAMIFTFIWAWLYAWKQSGRTDLPVAAANIIFFLMAMYMARLTIVYAAIWLPSMVFLSWRTGLKPAFPKTGPLMLTAFILLTALTAAKAAFLYEDRRWFGLGYQDYVPVREVAFIMDNQLPGPIFNDYLSGGYMMWSMYPKFKVFIDPRHAPYLDRVLPDYLDIGTPQFPLNRQGLNAFMNRYPARIALISHQQTHLIDWLRNSPDWSLAYFDVNASVLLHRDIGANLSPEARAVSLSPERFKHVSNPTVLRDLFVYYYLLNPRLAVPIRDFYEQNINNLYHEKTHTLATMNSMLANKTGPPKGR